MSPDITLLGTLGTISVILLFYILAKLSERLGSVERMSPIYRYYYVAITLTAIGAVTHILAARITLSPQGMPAWLSSPWFLLLTYYLPLTVAVTISSIVTWRYWSWIITEFKKIE